MQPLPPVASEQTMVAGNSSRTLHGGLHEFGDLQVSAGPSLRCGPTCAASSCSFLAASVGPRPCCCGPVRPEADENTCSADSMAATVITSSRHLRAKQQG